MLFGRKRKAGGHTRYGRSPLLTNKPSTIKNRRRIAIPNVAMPSLKTVKRILLGLVACVIIGAVTYFFNFSPYFKILKVTVQYDELQSENNDIVKYFDPLKGKNILFADVNSVIKTIQKDHPEISNLTVKKTLPSALEIHFSQYPIVANIEKITEGNPITEKMLINSIGMRMYGDSENPNLPYIKIIYTSNASVAPNASPDAAPNAPNTPAAYTVGVLPAPVPLPNPDTAPTDPVISPENLSYILKATNYFEEKFGMKIIDTEFRSEARELRIKTEKYFSIWLDTQMPFERQFLKLKKAMVQLDIYKQPLEYIDLRITGTSGEKVIFKRKK